MKEIDARGLACPAPVLQAKTAIETQRLNAVRVVVDNAAAQQNVQRFLETQGYESTLETDSDGYVVVGLYGSYRLKLGGSPVRLYAGIDNLFNEKYDDNLRINAARGRFG